MGNNSTEKRLGERIEPHPGPDVQLFIQGMVRELINISDHGFGIMIDTPKGFHLGQRIDDIHLNMAGNSHQLHGAVAHISRTQTGCLLGIRLDLKSIEEYRLIADLKYRCEAPD